MENTCHRCGALVAEGAPFCSQCGAPQIRINVSASQAVTAPLPPGTPDEIQPPAQPVLTGYLAAQIRWHDAWPGILLAGAVVGVVSSLPVLGIGFFLWVAAGGVWSLALYQKRTAFSPITSSQGLGLGALTGAVAFAVYSLLLGIGLLFFHTGPQFRDALRQAFEDAAARSGGGPQTQEMLNFLLSPGGFASVITLMMAIFLLIFLVCGALGGAFGASYFGQKHPR